MNLKKEFKFHPQWPYVLQVLDTLRKAGYQAFIVGGAVRDVLMKIPIKDFDVSTNARPEEVEKLFSKTIDIGKAFGVMAVVMEEGITIEVTTFREESEYNSKRQPMNVKFTDLQGDASRRDFTINALYYEAFKDELVDPFGGKEDIQNRCLRAIGVAKERLVEDPLRILRAVRFHARFDFAMDEKLTEALHETAPLISGVAKERVFEELKNSFQFHSWKRALKVFDELKLWGPLNWPAPSAKQLQSLLGLSVDGSFLETLAWLWREEPQEETKSLLEDLKVSGKFKEAYFYFLDQGTKLLNETPRKGERFLIFSKAPPGFIQFLKGLSELMEREEKFKELQKDFAEYKGLLDGHGQLPSPLVTGEDLIHQGIKKGPVLGALKKELYLKQLEGSFTSPKQLAKFLKEFRRTSNEV